MKLISKLLLVVCLIAFASCRDTKKEEEAIQQAVEQIESIESEVNEATEQLGEKASEVEEALKELDSI